MSKDNPMVAQSKSQRRLFGWAKACVDNKTDNCPTKIKKLGKTFKEKYPDDLKSLAKTKHLGLPNKKKNESVIKFDQFNEGYNYNTILQNLNDFKRQIFLNDKTTEFDEYSILDMKNAFLDIINSTDLQELYQSIKSNEGPTYNYNNENEKLILLILNKILPMDEI